MNPAAAALEHATWAQSQGMTPQAVMRSINMDPLAEGTTWGRVVDALTVYAVQFRGDKIVVPKE